MYVLLYFLLISKHIIYIFKYKRGLFEYLDKIHRIARKHHNGTVMLD